MNSGGNLIRNMGPRKLIFQDVISHICDWQSFTNFAISKFELWGWLYSIVMLTKPE